MPPGQSQPQRAGRCRDIRAAVEFPWYQWRHPIAREGNTMAQKKREKAAKKALAAARDAVADAKQAVKKLDKKSRREADDLATKLKASERSARKAIARGERTGATRQRLKREVTTVVQVDAPTPSTPVPSAVSLPVASSGDLALLTHRELRERARTLGVPGSSRMRKADLIVALSAR
jgi:monoamine oxidase